MVIYQSECIKIIICIKPRLNIGMMVILFFSKVGQQTSSPSVASASMYCVCGLFMYMPVLSTQSLHTRSRVLRDLSEISRGGGGVETEGGSQFFETAERGWVMKNGPLKRGGSCKYVSVIM